MCIFTSAGDWHRVHTWQWKPIYVTFYGDKEPSFPPGVQVWRHKDLKFPNLKWWLSQVEIDCKYLAVFDDDLLLGDIGELLRAAEESDANIFAPSLTDSTYASLRPQGIGLRQVEFIEMGYPIFKVSFLKKFMQVYDTQVQDWGVDIWFSHFSQGQLVVSDFHTIRNPPLRLNGKREIERHPQFKLFQQRWLNFSREKGLPSKPPPSAFLAPKGYFYLPLCIFLFILLLIRKRPKMKL